MFKLKELLKKIPFVDRLYFLYINGRYNLNLSFQENQSQLSIFKEVFFHKAYELGFPRGVKKTVIVDIGAHYGYFSIYAAKNAGIGSKVYAVEPSFDNIRQFERNIRKAKISNVLSFQNAIAGATFERPFYTSKAANHSLFENYLAHMVSSKNVKCLSLEDFMNQNEINHIDFLKIDCEGSEHEIIQNTSTRILTKIRTISMEIHDMRHCGYDNEKTIEVLKNVGFEILFSDYEYQKDKKGFNARIVFQRIN